jgi:hypothetical protein
MKNIKVMITDSEEYKLEVDRSWIAGQWRLSINRWIAGIGWNYTELYLSPVELEVFCTAFKGALWQDHLQE